MNNEKKYLPHIAIKIAKKTVPPLSNKYVTLIEKNRNINHTKDCNKIEVIACLRYCDSSPDSTRSYNLLIYSPVIFTGPSIVYVISSWAEIKKQQISLFSSPSFHWTQPSFWLLSISRSSKKPFYTIVKHFNTVKRKKLVCKLKHYKFPEWRSYKRQKSGSEQASSIECCHGMVPDLSCPSKCAMGPAVIYFM